MAENIAHGYRSPPEVVNGWLRDGGAADRSAGDRHRRNLMSAKFREAGVGSAEEGPREVHDTQDFGSGAPDCDTPLVSGSHVPAPGNEIMFLASYRAPDAEPPAGAFVEIDGKLVGLTLAFGSERSGSYPALLARATLPALSLSVPAPRRAQVVLSRGGKPVHDRRGRLQPRVRTRRLIVLLRGGAPRSRICSIPLLGSVSWERRCSASSSES